jgi:DNA-directed RNA polymerase specialized sigma24 family protein
MTGCSDAANQRGRDWQRLRDDLTAWLQCRFRRVDAANIAGDAVLFAMLRFGAEPIASRGMAWSWLCRTAVNRVYHDHRRAKRCVVSFVSAMDSIESVRVTGRTRAMGLVEEMLVATRGIEHQVLVMLWAGSPTNREMAAFMGVDRRTIERARAKLRHRFRELLGIRREGAGLEHL